MQVTKDILRPVFGNVDDRLIEGLNDVIQRYEIDTKERLAAFLAQIGHESGGFRVLQENLNYSRQGLLKVFPKYFNESNVDGFVRQPAKIANRVYANRMGNGDEASGDGYRYRGRGCIQLTGKANYQKCSDSVGVDFVSEPDLLTNPEYAVISAAWFWGENRLNRFVDSGNFEGLCKAINGGKIGLAERKMLYSKLLGVIK